MSLLAAFGVSAIFISLAFALGLWTGLAWRKNQLRAARQSERDWRAAARQSASEALAGRRARAFLGRVFDDAAKEETRQR